MTGQLVYLIYGREQSFLEGRYSILTAFARARDGVDVLICTDQPARFVDWPVRTLHLTPELQKQWRGPHDHNFRMKLMSVAETLESAERTVFVDADTVLTADPARLFDRLTGDVTLMDYDEGPLDESSYHWPDCNMLFDALRAGSIRRTDGTPFVVKPGTHNWNGGVIAVSRNHRELMRDAIAVNDQLFAIARWWFTEQFALSLVFGQFTRLQAARGMVEHYWSVITYPGWHGGKAARTLYHEQASRFFQTHQGKSFDEMVEALRKRPPEIYRISAFRIKIAAVLRRTIRRPKRQ